MTRLFIIKENKQGEVLMIFERIRNLREDSDKKQQELADYLLGRTNKKK